MNFMSLLFGIVLGGAITFFTQYFLWKAQQETKLREKTFDFRFEAYKKLWEVLGKLHYYDRDRDGEINYLHVKEHNKKMYLELNELKWRYGPFYDNKTRQNISDFLARQIGYFHIQGTNTAPGDFPDELERIKGLIFENSIKYFEEEVVRTQLNIIESIELLFTRGKAETRGGIIGKGTTVFKIIGAITTILGIVLLYLVEIEGMGVEVGFATWYRWRWMPVIKWLILSIGPMMYILADMYKWWKQRKLDKEMKEKGGR